MRSIRPKLRVAILALPLVGVLAAPTAAVAMNNQRLSGLAAPTSAS